jgi:hypothetical protein
MANAPGDSRSVSSLRVIGVLLDYVLSKKIRMQRRFWLSVPFLEPL